MKFRAKMIDVGCLNNFTLLHPRSGQRRGFWDTRHRRGTETVAEGQMMQMGPAAIQAPLWSQHQRPFRLHCGTSTRGHSGSTVEPAPAAIQAPLWNQHQRPFRLHCGTSTSSHSDSTVEPAAAAIQAPLWNQHQRPFRSMWNLQALETRHSLTFMFWEKISALHSREILNQPCHPDLEWSTFYYVIDGCCTVVV
ncbi:hypothetical protein COCON_G00136830 [Conger conger]|uniref:Uncharacterized protein n=1 Tax=Conger conger TaxID=82655 RepID=A0A9Q1HXQ0_CONCO|nr:hypothetical protein COCON_G00136830 [Conger conger]